jgi:hypothetical protein
MKLTKLNINTDGGQSMQGKSLSRKITIDPGENDLALKAGARFPTTRYFQIHFEFLQNQLQQTTAELQDLKTQVCHLERQLTIAVHMLSPNRKTDDQSQEQ